MKDKAFKTSVSLPKTLWKRVKAKVEKENREHQITPPMTLSSYFQRLAARDLEEDARGRQEAVA